MSISINPTIFSNSVHTTNASLQQESNSHSFVSTDIISQQINTYSSLFDDVYFTPLKAGLDAIQDAIKGISKVKNTSVAKQAIKTLIMIRDRLSYLSQYNDLQNRLPKILLTVSEDESVLLEWNFEYFRLGISLEADDTASSYYVISQEKKAGAFSSITDQLNQCH